jgi:hypothetical protein
LRCHWFRWPWFASSRSSSCAGSIERRRTLRRLRAGLGRCFLEPRRSVYLIEAGGRCFLVGRRRRPYEPARRNRQGGPSHATLARATSPAQLSARYWPRCFGGAADEPAFGRSGRECGQDQGLATRPVLLFIAVAAVSILPFILLLMTSFVKIAVVLSILEERARGAPDSTFAGHHRARADSHPLRDGADRRAHVSRHRARPWAVAPTRRW